MNRRDFLKVGGLLSAALALPFHALITGESRLSEVQSGDQVYRGTRDGKLLISPDAGLSWRVHTNFGPEFSIVDLSSSLSGHVYAQLEFAGHTFELVLEPNGQTWRTARALHS